MIRFSPNGITWGGGGLMFGDKSGSYENHEKKRKRKKV